LTGPRILVVEDDFLIRLTLAEALSADGFEVVEAASAEEALQHLGDLEVAVLLTDIQLPGRMNGLQLARHMREQRPDLPIIYTTGRLHDIPESDGREVFIAKPYLPSQICTAVRLLAAG
jgi:CheY-like chemotaxis protein